MQELISKEAVLEALSDMSRGYSIAREEIKALPTTVHHEYKVGEEYSFSNDWINWVAKAQLHWIRYETETMDWYYIRPFPPTPAEHPDIIQARELASKHWMILIPKE